MTTTIDEVFELCCDCDGRFEKPFHKGGYLYATDGRICIRRVEEGPDAKNIPRVDEVFSNNAPKSWRPFQVNIPLCECCNGEIRKISNQCPSCDGDGECYECNGEGEKECSCCDKMSDCDECGGLGDCPECNGTGICDPYVDRCYDCKHEPIVLDSCGMIARLYASIIAKLPGVEWSSCGGNEQMIAFRSGEIEGRLMMMR